MNTARLIFGTLDVLSPLQRVETFIIEGRSARCMSSRYKVEWI